ncbi:MAG: hypothetical protein OEZ06_31510 [Myxococcales bacterium]|nr:hypothetical protein [Myxococcales bacterium]
MRPASLRAFERRTPAEAFELVGQVQPELGTLRRADGSYAPSQACHAQFAQSFQWPRGEAARLAEPEDFMQFNTRAAEGLALGASFGAIGAALGYDQNEQYLVELQVGERARAQARDNAVNSFYYCCAIDADNCEGQHFVSEVGTLSVRETRYAEVGGALSAQEHYAVEGSTVYRRVEERARGERFYYVRLSPLPRGRPLARDDLSITGPAYINVGDGKPKDLGQIQVLLSPARRFTHWTLSSKSSLLQLVGDDGKPQASVRGGCRQQGEVLSCSERLGLRLSEALGESQEVAIEATLQDDHSERIVEAQSFHLFLYRKSARGGSLYATPNVTELDFARDGRPKQLVLEVHARAVEPGEIFGLVAYPPPGVGVSGAHCDGSRCSVRVMLQGHEGVTPRLQRLLVGVSRSSLPGLLWPLQIAVQLPAPEPDASGFDSLRQLWPFSAGD